MKKKLRSIPPSSPPSQTAIANLEMAGEQLRVYSLQNLLKNKRYYRTSTPSNLGEFAASWYEKEIARPAAKLSGVNELWISSVPEAILQHSTVLGFHRSILTVGLTSAPVRAELEALLRRGLLTRLQTDSRGAIFRVKTQIFSQPVASR